MLDRTGYQDLKLQDLRFCVRSDIKLKVALWNFVLPNLMSWDKIWCFRI